MTVRFANGGYTTGLPGNAIQHNNWATQRGLPANFAPAGEGPVAGNATGTMTYGSPEETRYYLDYSQRAYSDPRWGSSAPPLSGQVTNSLGAGYAAAGAPQGYGYTAGPAGTAGGLAPSTPGASPLDLGQNSQVATSYEMGGLEPGGYGTAPNQGNLGYYQQNTPLGGFAAANQQWSQGQAPVQQQVASTAQAGPAATASNPYLGQLTQGIGQQSSVMPYAQQIAQAGQQANPYLGATTQQIAQAGQNQFMGRNPYLESSVSDALSQASDNFRATVMPQFDRMERQSGAYGNSGVQAARNRAMDAFGRNQSAMATNAYMQDYGASQQLAENALNRGQAVNIANAGLQQNDLSRNLSGAYTGQQLGMQGLGQQLGAAQFDAGLSNNVGQFNASLADTGLGRNQGLANSLGQFNAGAQNQGRMFDTGQANSMGQFNAGQGNQLGQFNAQLGQNNNQFNAGQGNAINLQNTGWGNAMLENARNRIQQGGQFDRSLAQQQGQFDANLDRNIYNDNMGWMRQGTQDQIAFMNQLMGWNQQGINNATNVQNTPLNNLTQFANLANMFGGAGGSQVTPLYGNPYLGAIGGWQLGNAMFGGRP
jgi:hypothetical protein